MSYCVNCGVEIGGEASKCPLCGVAVVNPAAIAIHNDHIALPRRDKLESAFDRDLWIKIVSILLSVPAAICFLSNMMYHNDTLWSLYVIGGLVVGWVYCVAPLVFKRYFPLLWIIANTLATLGYLYLIETLSGSAGWFFPLVLPIVLGVAVLSLAIIVLMDKGVLREMDAAAGICLAIGLLTVLIELSVSLYSLHKPKMTWSWFSLISCAAMAAVLILIQRKLRLKDKLKRKLHI